MSLNVIFMGTPDFAVPTLKRIVADGHQVAAVYTQPPRPAGRGMAARKSPVHTAADQHDVRVLTPKSLKDPENQERLASFACDVAIIVAYGLILPRPILDAPRQGCFNLHASLLPRWRGAAPIQRAIMAGDRESGVMVMRMEEGLDTGPVCMTDRVAITPDMTAGALHDILAMRGGALVGDFLKQLEHAGPDCVAQTSDGVTYAKKIDKSESRIDWNQPAGEIHNLIRGLSPFPGAWCEMNRDGGVQRVKVLESRIVAASGRRGVPGTLMDDRLTIACGDGVLRLIRLQRAGKKPMDGETFMRGWPVAPGTVLGDAAL